MINIPDRNILAMIFFIVFALLMMRYSGVFKKKKDRTNCSIRCESCGNELTDDDSFISDTYDKNGDNHVKYKCQKCGLKSDYNFDLAPVPVNWKGLRIKK
jgi:hypothetical protein